MYKKEVFEAVFGIKDLDEKGITELLVRKEFLDSMFSVDSTFLKIYANLHGESPAYSIAKEWFDLIVGLHPAFFTRTKIEGKRVMELETFLAKKFNNPQTIDPTHKWFNRHLDPRTKQTAVAFNYIKEKVITAESMSIINSFFEDSSRTILISSNIGEVQFNKYSFVALMLTGISRSDYEAEHLQFNKIQKTVIKNFILTHLKDYSAARALELQGNLVTQKQVRGVIKDTTGIKDWKVLSEIYSFELLYYSILDALNKEDPDRVVNITTLFRGILTCKIEELITVK